MVGEGIRRALPTLGTVFAVAVVAALALPALLGAETEQGAVVVVGYQLARPSTSALDLAANVTTRWTLTVHIGILSGVLIGGSRPILLFYDPRFPVVGGNLGELQSFRSQLAEDLVLAGDPHPLQVVDAEELPGALESNPRGILVDVSGVLPASVLSNSSNVLPTWIRGGGEMVWAGGPLGYSEGYVDSAGHFVSENLGWPGEFRVAGFWLEDPLGNPLILPSGPLFGSRPTNWSEALGLEYNGTADGANVTQLDWHNGSALGYESVGNFPLAGASPRTSLAYVPLGQGALYYFGGGYFYHDIGYLVQYSAFLAGDIAVLTAHGFLVQYGPAVGTSVTVLSGTAAHLSLVLDDPTYFSTILVSSEAGGQYFFLAEYGVPIA